MAVRLIDANELWDSIRKDTAPFNVAMVSRHIHSSPTIDPETLPIVRELRKQLAEVTRERDSLRIFYNDIVSNPDCNTCKNKNCEYRPKPGDTTRFNCPLWEGED